MSNQNSSIINSITTQNGIITFREDGILTFVPHLDKKNITLESMNEDMDAFKKLSENKRMPFLSDNRTLNDFSTEQKKFMQAKIPEFSSKFAVLIDSGLSIFFFNTFQLFYKPEVPMKAFKNKELAIKWLLNND